MVTETLHTRSRRAALGGLLVQIVAFIATMILAQRCGSKAAYDLAWYILGGVPIWFVSLLVFRQHELAALEQLDLEELRREKAATGGGDALFDAEGGMGLGFRVAAARLKWMQKWVMPSFSLITAGYLIGVGAWLWLRLTSAQLHVGSEGWGELRQVPIALVVFAILMLGMFLLSRYTSGLGRVNAWQLLRGCGSYMLGNVLAVTALIICLGVYQYARVATWEQTLAFVIPALMIVLGVETLLNFVLDIYRPRATGIEPRAAFDSRLLGLIAEPGGIAKSIADAVNYQFGFQVSQTWFYQLLQRTALPLVAAGVVAMWLLTCIVIVQPFEHVLVTRWGHLLNADQPYGPGIHFKWPWPIEAALPFNTGELHQISVGWKQFDAEPKDEADEKRQSYVLLWTDEKHKGLEHFDFVVAPPPQGDTATQPATPTGLAADTRAKAQPVHLMRMEVAVQYRIKAEELARYAQAMEQPEAALRDIAWQEVVRYGASSTAEFLLGQDLSRIGVELQQRIAARVADLGLEIIYVGVTNVHPEKTVAESYREVIGAELQKVASIREARVVEEERLSKVAGDAELARALARTISRSTNAANDTAVLSETLRGLDRAQLLEFIEPLQAHGQLIQQVRLAEAALEDARDRQVRVNEDYRLGLDQRFGAEQGAQQAVDEAEAALKSARAARDEALGDWQRTAQAALGAEAATALRRRVAAELAGVYWNGQLQEEFSQSRLGGEAASTLAAAQAYRWSSEMQQAALLARLEREREAFAAAPGIYRTRALVAAFVNAMKGTRKYVLPPGNRTVRVRFTAKDQPGMDQYDWMKETETPPNQP